MEQKQQDSPVIKLLQIIWNHTCDGGHSWERLNAALQNGLILTIDYGFVFERTDFDVIAKRFRPGYWMGSDDGQVGEGYYSRAVNGGYGGRSYPNLSAAKAFEQWKQRKPFIIKGRRLAIGSELPHPEHGRLWVTSIDADKIGACWYDNQGNHKQGKPAKRFTFTHKEIRAIAKAEGKEAK